jgi:hypothetical protein
MDARQTPGWSAGRPRLPADDSLAARDEAFAELVLNAIAGVERDRR